MFKSLFNEAKERKRLQLEAEAAKKVEAEAKSTKKPERSDEMLIGYYCCLHLARSLPSIPQRVSGDLRDWRRDPVVHVPLVGYGCYCQLL